MPVSTSLITNGFLPAAYQAVPITAQQAIRNLNAPAELKPEAEKAARAEARRLVDESLKELARGIDKVLPGRFNRIYGFNKGLNRYLVESTGNGVPGQFLAGDRAAGTLKVTTTY